MMLFGKISLVAAVLLLVAAPLRAMAEGAVAPPAAQPSGEIPPDEPSAEDLINTKDPDPVGEEWKRRQQEERDNAKQAIHALRLSLLEEMRIGICCSRSFDIEQWNRGLERAEQALDEGKPLPELYEIRKELENEVDRDIAKERAAGRTGGGCTSEVGTLPDIPESEEAKNLREKLLRAGGRFRILLELVDSLMKLTDSTGCGHR
jgi:hypothetical protein